MRWSVCVELPVITLPRPVPLVVIISLAMSTFSPPWSHLTQDGNPYSTTAALKHLSTVDARLFEHCRNVTTREKPSIPTWKFGQQMLKINSYWIDLSSWGRCVIAWRTKLLKSASTCTTLVASGWQIHVVHAVLYLKFVHIIISSGTALTDLYVHVASPPCTMSFHLINLWFPSTCLYTK